MSTAARQSPRPPTVFPAPQRDCPRSARQSARCSRTTGTARSGSARTTTCPKRTSPAAAADPNGRCRRGSTGSTDFSAARPTSSIRIWSRTTGSSNSRTAPRRAITCPGTSPIRPCGCCRTSRPPIRRSRGTCGSAPERTMRRTTPPPNTPTSTRASSTTATRRTGTGCWPA